MTTTKLTRLTVVEDLGMRQHGFSTRARHMLRCLCSCGSETVVRKDAYESGHTDSCGCLNREQVAAAARGKNRSKVKIGETYEHLTVLKRLPNGPRGEAVYLCQCQCGNTSRVRGQSLTGHQIRRCKKCGYKEHLAKIHTLRTKPPGEAACRAAFVMTKNQCATKRNLFWEISLEEWKRLTQLVCHYCGAPPSNCARGGYGRNGDYRYNGLDRVDNGVGYVLTNIVPCCKRCNCAKSDQTVAEFLAWAKRINDHSRL